MKAPAAGFIHGMDSRALGLLAMELGAGRRHKDDVLDRGVGLRVHGRVGQAVEAVARASSAIGMPDTVIGSYSGDAAEFQRSLAAEPNMPSRLTR